MLEKKLPNKNEVHINLTHYRPAMPFGNISKYFRGSFSSVLSQFKKISPLWKSKIKSFRNISTLKISFFLTEKILPISLKLNFTPNTLGCYGLDDYSCGPVYSDSVRGMNGTLPI